MSTIYHLKAMNKKDGIFISNKDFDNLQKIIDYLLDSEKNHIYAITRKLKDALS